MPFKKRMGWAFPWISSHNSDFNYDFHASSSSEELAAGKILYNYKDVESGDFGEEHHGMSVFYKNNRDDIFHT